MLDKNVLLLVEHELLMKKIEEYYKPDNSTTASVMSGEITGIINLTDVLCSYIDAWEDANHEL